MQKLKTKRRGCCKAGFKALCRCTLTYTAMVIISLVYIAEIILFLYLPFTRTYAIMRGVFVALAICIAFCNQCSNACPLPCFPIITLIMSITMRQYYTNMKQRISVNKCMEDDYFQRLRTNSNYEGYDWLDCVDQTEEQYDNFAKLLLIDIFLQTGIILFACGFWCFFCRSRKDAMEDVDDETKKSNWADARDGEYYDDGYGGYWYHGGYMGYDFGGNWDFGGDVGDGEGFFGDFGGDGGFGDFAGGDFGGGDGWGGGDGGGGGGDGGGGGGDGGGF